MQFEKRAVRLGDIRPSGQNPREDFGDIGALARSIEATGGEPLNPPVVVADGNVFRIWAHLGLVAAKLEDKEYPAGTVAVWNDRYWDFFAPKGGEDAEPEKTEEEIRAEQEAAREDAALKGLYRSLIGFVASGAFAMSKDLMMEVRVGRADPPALLAAMGGDSNPENEERFGAVRDEFARNLKACKPNEYEAGCWLMAAAKDMAQLNNRWGGDDAEAWLDHYDIFCSAGFEPGEEDVWLMERVQASFKEEKKDE